jgi:hypothetical protein
VHIYFEKQFELFSPIWTQGVFQVEFACHQLARFYSIKLCSDLWEFYGCHVMAVPENCLQGQNPCLSFLCCNTGSCPVCWALTDFTVLKGPLLWCKTFCKVPASISSPHPLILRVQFIGKIPIYPRFNPCPPPKTFGPFSWRVLIPLLPQSTCISPTFLWYLLWPLNRAYGEVMHSVSLERVSYMKTPVEGQSTQ